MSLLYTAVQGVGENSIFTISQFLLIGFDTILPECV